MSVPHQTKDPTPLDQIDGGGRGREKHVQHVALMAWTRIGNTVSPLILMRVKGRMGRGKRPWAERVRPWTFRLKKKPRGLLQGIPRTRRTRTIVMEMRLGLQSSFHLFSPPLHTICGVKESPFPLCAEHGVGRRLCLLDAHGKL
jgi:hypothetical protein